MTLARESRPSAAVLMLAASAAGMMLGYAIDSRSGDPGALASLCHARPESLIDAAAWHWQLLRASFIGMVSGGFAMSAAIEYGGLYGCAPRRVARLTFDLACHVAMVIGMIVSGWLGPSVATVFGIGWGPVGMMASMTVGMTFGVAIWAASDRLMPRAMSVATRSSPRLDARPA